MSVSACIRGHKFMCTLRSLHNCMCTSVCLLFMPHFYSFLEAEIVSLDVFYVIISLPGIRCEIPKMKKKSASRQSILLGRLCYDKHNMRTASHNSQSKSYTVRPLIPYQMITINASEECCYCFTR